MILLHKLIQRFSHALPCKGCSETPAVNRSGERGFSLLELAIVVAIGGVMSAGGMVMYNNYVREKAVVMTEAKSDKVLDAISSYVQRYNRLPCPAIPADFGGVNEGTEQNNGQCFQSASADLAGVLPWRDLGLSREDAKDSWGRFYTYKPSPSLTIDTDAAADKVSDIANSAVVHASCRTPGWYTNKGNAAGTRVHANRAKALFCCNSRPPDDFLTSTLGQSTNLNNAHFDKSAGGENTARITNAQADRKPAIGGGPDYFSGFGEANIQGLTNANGTPDAPMIRTGGVALTLVSHGANGNFAINTDGQQIPDTGGNPAEQTNASGDQLASIYNPKISQGMLDRLGNRNGSADDIVVVLRADQVYSRVGQASCVKPALLEMRDLDKCQMNPAMCTCPSEPSICKPICDDDPLTADIAACTGDCTASAMQYPVVGVTSCSNYFENYNTNRVSALTYDNMGVTITCPDTDPSSLFITWRRFDRGQVAATNDSSALAYYDAAPGACPPSSCSPPTGGLTWSDDQDLGSVCNATFATTVANNATVSVTDTTAEGVGTATYLCQNGELTLQSGQRCGCAPRTSVSWTSSGEGGSECQNTDSGLGNNQPFYPGYTPVHRNVDGGTGNSDWSVEDNSTSPTPKVGEAEYNCVFDEGIGNVRWQFVCGSCE